MKSIVLTLLLLLFSLQAFAEDAKEVEVNHVTLATLMIYDGKLDKARHELSLVDKKSANYDAADYYTVYGVLESKSDEINASIENYKKAIDATKVKEFKAPKAYAERKYLFSIGEQENNENAPPPFDPEKVRKEKLDKLYVYLSQAFYKVKDYQNSVDALDNAGELGRNKASLYAFRADCYWKLEKRSEAVDALSTGYDKFKDPQLLRQKFYYYADLGLYQSAIDTMMVYMNAVGKKDEDYISLAQMLIGAGENDAAIRVLEEAKLRFPKNAKIGVLLAHSYLKKQMNYTGAALLETSSYYDRKYLKDSVEIYRRVKNYPHAIFLNSLMLDNEEKLKQKVAIYIEREEYEKVIGLKAGLERNGMLKDDNLRYALAYAYYMAKDYDAAEAQLKQITDNELFGKATVIRKNIEKCRNDSMECI